MPLKGANLEIAKSLNRRVAFEAIYRHGPISRTEVANETRLTPQTVSNIVAELSPYGLITEKSLHTGRKGKPAREYAIDKDGVLIIGLHIDQHEIVGCLTNIVGEIQREHRTELQNQEPGYVQTRAETVIDALLEGDEKLRRRLLGVGVAMPGVFDNGVFLSGNALTMKDWKGYPLANSLSKRIGLPVFVENDGTTAAIGEGLFGAAKHVQSFIYVYFGLGLGGGLLINGSVYSGANNRSAEFGHIIVVPGGRACPCGNLGCLERYVSLFSAYQAIKHTDIEYTSVNRQEVLDAFLDEDPALMEWRDEAAMHLSTGVNILENIFDPERVFLGGTLPEPLLRSLVSETEKVRSGTGSRTERSVSSRPRLEIVTGDVSLGAAALPLSVLLDPPPSDHAGIGYVRPTEGESLYNLLTGH